MDPFHKKPEYYRALSDFQLQLLVKKFIVGSADHDQALEEMLRRKSEKEHQDRRTQKHIKTMTFVILILTAATLILMFFR